MTAEWTWVPSDAIEDMQEAGTCYAIGRYAATILFAVRATEWCLRGFFAQIVFLETPEVGRGWLTATVKLPEAKGAALATQQRLRSEIGDLRKLRNAAMHAGKRKTTEWDANAAREVIAKCREAIESMPKCLEEHRSSRQVGLPSIGD